MGLGLLSRVWVWVCCGSGFAAVGCGDCGLILFLFFFSFFLVLMVDYGLLVVVVSSVCSATVVGSW